MFTSASIGYYDIIKTALEVKKKLSESKRDSIPVSHSEHVNLVGV